MTEARRIRTGKWIDEYVGRYLIPLLYRLRPFPPRQIKKADVMRILFIKFWGIGSIVLTEPAMRRLREQFPRAQLDFLTLASNAGIFSLIEHVDRVYTLEFRNLPGFLISSVRTVAQLRRRRYDLVFDAEFFANFSALISRLMKPRQLIGFSRPTSRKNLLLDLAVAFDDNQHAAYNFGQLVLQCIGGRIESEQATLPRVYLPRSVVRIPRRQPVVVMNVNSSPLALERRWPAERFVSLAKWLMCTYNTELVLIGDDSERQYTNPVAEAIRTFGRVRNLAGLMRIAELADLISSSALVISSDSGPIHLAAALQKPVVGFYGPESPDRFGPLCDMRLIFYLGLPCSPCMSVDNAKTVNCTNHRQCMIDVSVGMVIPRIQRFINENDLLTKRTIQREVAFEL